MKEVVYVKHSKEAHLTKVKIEHNKTSSIGIDGIIIINLLTFSVPIILFNILLYYIINMKKGLEL